MTVRVATAIDFSRHAHERYRERVGPQIDDAQLACVLAEVACHGALTTRPPQWFADRAQKTSALYLVVGDIVFPLLEHPDGERWIAKTCVARGGISPLARERRNSNRAADRRQATRKRA